MVGFHPKTQAHSDLENSVESLLDVLSDLKTGYEYQKEFIESLLKRSREQNLYLALVGQVKRGKSTLLNALIGKDILPSSIIPVTAIPTFVRYSDRIMVDVVFFNSSKKHIDAESVEEAKNFICNYVVEEKNPENKMKVSYVDVFIQADILKNGMVLIDTPGIGSTYLHNTETTLNFVPECDAALFVTSVDPPITELELEFLKRLAKHMRNIYFVLNKIDYLSDEELDVAKKFFGKILNDNGFQQTVVHVSARRALTGKLQKNEKLLKSSNIGNIEALITGEIVSKKKAMIDESISIKMKNAISEILTTLELEMKSLKMPVNELEKKLKLLNQELDGFEREKNIILDSLEGERKRLHEQLEDYCSQITKKARTYLQGIVNENSVKAENVSEFYEIARRKVAEAIPGFFENENGVAIRFFEKKIHQINSFYNDRISKICDRIRQIISGIFEVDYEKTGRIFEFELTHQPYWVTHVWIVGFQPFSEDLVDMVLTPSRKMKKVMVRVQSQIDELIMQNIENLRWSIFQSIDRFFIRFKNFFEKYFSEMTHSTIMLINELLKEKNCRIVVEDRLRKLEEKKKLCKSLLEKLD
ncbi:MAG: dynamin family protein [Candidatus Omnitrophica bacterium]|nr:dynamin family protein [Candidatus Omnitrophota bacterium]